MNNTTDSTFYWCNQVVALLIVSATFFNGYISNASNVCKGHAVYILMEPHSHHQHQKLTVSL